MRVLMSPKSVDEQVALVEREYNTASVGLSGAPGGFFYGLTGTKSPAEHSLGVLKNMRPQIDKWIEIGRLASREKREPSSTLSWQEWVDKGNIYLAGIRTQFETGRTDNVRLIAELATDTVASAKALPKKVAKEVGETASALAVSGLPFFLVAGGVVLLALLGRKAVTG